MTKDEFIDGYCTRDLLQVCLQAGAVGSGEALTSGNAQEDEP